ncbi:AP-5 complex subunit sigma-1-like [Acanthaster planci]|uniref:AP-5 complex subunit sigma-1-like n=1 Tax=Acanthaster planci TaxID=133434 RepID=A0A8B7Y0F9_ACAPL|nr:AP-5 complex subunit sigma-1-like [Acanthaster planci]
MVYAFIIHTLNPSVEAEACRVLYACTFGSEDSLDDPAELPLSSNTSDQVIDRRTFKKEQLALVGRQVQSEYSFRRSACSRDQSEQVAGGLSLAVSLDDAGQWDVGFFRLLAGDPFRMEKVVVWLGLANIGLALVCERSENRLLAESTLKLLLRYLQEHVQAATQPAELLTRGDRVAIIVHQFLPSGRLVFMNYAVIRQLEKDMENLLRGK